MGGIVRGRNSIEILKGIFHHAVSSRGKEEPDINQENTKNKDTQAKQCPRRGTDAAKMTTKPSRMSITAAELSRPLAAVVGSVNSLTEVNKDATPSEVLAACTARCTEGVPESQFLGWRPLWSTAKTWHCEVPRMENPKGDSTREGGLRLRPLSPLLCFHLFDGLPQRESRALSRVHGPRPDSLPKKLQRRGLPGDLVRGVSPTFSRMSFREEASLGTFKLQSPPMCPTVRIANRLHTSHDVTRNLQSTNVTANPSDALLPLTSNFEATAKVNSSWKADCDEDEVNRTRNCNQLCGNNGDDHRDQNLIDPMRTSRTNIVNTFP